MGRCGADASRHSVRGGGLAPPRPRVAMDARVCLGGGNCLNASALAALHHVRWPEASDQDPFRRCCHCDTYNGSTADYKVVRRCSNSAAEEMYFVSSLLPFLRFPPDHQPTFVELGGNNGLHASNTLYLEHCLHWRGVMLEGHPEYIKHMWGHRPGLITIGSAVCSSRQVARMAPMAETNSAVIEGEAPADRPMLLTPCAPLKDFFAPLGLGHIDLLSVDVEGHELIVLESIDWSQTAVATVIVEEFQYKGRTAADKAKNERNGQVKDLMHRLGYERALRHCFTPYPNICDHYYVHPSWYDVPRLRSFLESEEKSPKKWENGISKHGTERLVWPARPQDQCVHRGSPTG